MSNKSAGVFKKSFIGGFNKSDVLEYFDKMSYQNEQDKQELNSHIETLEQENSRLAGELRDCSAKLAEEQERAGASASYANGLRAELSRQQFLTEENNNELQLQRSLCGQMQIKLAECEEKAAQLERDKKECELKLGVLSAGRESSDAKISELEKRLEELNAGIAELEKSRSSAEKDAADARLNAGQLAAEITRLKDELSLAQSARDKAETRADDLQESLRQSLSRIDSLTDALNRAEAEREDAERRYAEAVRSAEAAAQKLTPDNAEQADSTLSDARERIDYVNNELASFKDEIQELRRLTAESFNTAERKLARLESTLESNTRTMESARGVAEGTSSVPQSGPAAAAAKMKKLPESIKNVGGAAKGVYQVACQSQSSLFESVMESLERLVGKWSK